MTIKRVDCATIFQVNFNMKNISILVVHNALIGAVGNARYLFEKVNDFLKDSGDKPLFDVKVVGINNDIKLDQGLYTVQVDALLDEILHTDLIIIPPMSGQMESVLHLNKKYVPWVSHHYKKGAEVASLCVGSFILADTGLLNGKKCSTHWQSAYLFRRMFPDVELVDEKIITDYNGIYTSGGSNSYWNLLIYLIEKYTNHELAIKASKYFEVEMDRDNQSQFRIFEGHKLHGDEPILKAQEFIEANFQDKITINQLADYCNLGRRTFQRRFKKATYYTVIEYIQNMRIEMAKKLLEANRLTVSEVMFETGYKDPKAFREVFKKTTGIPPNYYKNKYM
jgi:transcriptional regulator GlxA family with amidase domain